MTIWPFAKPSPALVDRLCELAVENALLRARSYSRAVRKDAKRYQIKREETTQRLREGR